MIAPGGSTAYDRSVDRTTDTLRDVILDLEHRFWEASTDAGFYREHALPDAVFVFPGGHGILSAEQVIEMVEANTTPWAQYRLDGVLLVEGIDAVTITYRAHARKAGSDTEFRAYASSVYMQFGGDWKLALHQQTLV